MNISTEKKQIHGHREQTCSCRGGGSGMDWEFGVYRYKLLHLEGISNETLLYVTGNYIQSLVMEQDGKYDKRNIYIYVYVCVRVYIYKTGSLCCTAEIDRHCKSTITLKIF